MNLEKVHFAGLYRILKSVLPNIMFDDSKRVYYMSQIVNKSQNKIDNSHNKMFAFNSRLIDDRKF
jgi:hypothetical protein